MSAQALVLLGSLGVVLSAACGGSGVSTRNSSVRPALPEDDFRHTYELPFTDDWDSKAVQAPDGQIYVSGPSEIVALRPSGQEAWRLRLSTPDKVRQLVVCGSRGVLALRVDEAQSVITLLNADGSVAFERSFGDTLESAAVDCNEEAEIAVTGWAPRGGEFNLGRATLRLETGTVALLRFGDTGESRWVRTLWSQPEDYGIARPVLDSSGGVSVVAPPQTEAGEVDESTPRVVSEGAGSGGPGTAVLSFRPTGAPSCRYSTLGGFVWFRAARQAADGSLLLGGTFRGDVDFAPLTGGLHRRGARRDANAILMKLRDCRPEWVWTTETEKQTDIVMLGEQASHVVAVSHIHDAGATMTLEFLTFDNKTGEIVSSREAPFENLNHFLWPVSEK